MPRMVFGVEHVLGKQLLLIFLFIVFSPLSFVVIGLTCDRGWFTWLPRDFCVSPSSQPSHGIQSRHSPLQGAVHPGVFLVRGQLYVTARLGLLTSRPPLLSRDKKRRCHLAVLPVSRVLLGCEY